MLPSRETVEKGTYQPLSRPLFIYVSKQSASRPEVKNFVDFYLTAGAELAAQVKYVPLPPQVYTIAREHFHKGKVGTVFQGTSAVGLKIEALLKRESKS